MKPQPHTSGVLPWALLAVPVLYLAALLASGYEDGMTVFDLMGRFSNLLERPFAIQYHCRSSTWTSEQECYTCSNYRTRKQCSAHYIRAVVLEQLVLQNLQRVLAYVQEDEDEFVRMVMENNLKSQLAEQEQAKRTLLKQTRRIDELDTIIQRLYEDNISGKLSDARFQKLSATYEQEQETLAVSVAELSAVVEASESQAVNVDKFLKVVRKYTQPTELTPAILRELVEKVVIHAPDKSGGRRVQRIDIHYNFIGGISLSPEYSKRTTA